MKEVYLDNAATTVTYKEVAQVVSQYFLNNYANPSSIHTKGMEASLVLNEAKANLKKLLKVDEGKMDVIFTSGASESVNLAIKGTLRKYNDISNTRIITSKIEHACTSEVFKYYASLGVDVVYIDVNQEGCINLEELISSITPNTKIISLIYVNNEFGAIQDLKKIIPKIKEKNPNCLVHIDAVQAVGKIKVDFSNADMISISAHKFHGPKGVGALVYKKNLTFVPLIHGGGQQNNLRSGTINTPLIAGMNEAVKIILQNEDKILYGLEELFKYAIKEVKEKLPNAKINTPYENLCAFHIISLSFKGIKGEVLLHMLEDDKIFVATSSACSSRSKKNHVVLEAIGLTLEEIDGTIRISFSEENTKEDIDYFIEKCKVNVEKLKKLSRLK